MNCDGLCNRHGCELVQCVCVCVCVMGPVVEIGTMCVCDGASCRNRYSVCVCVTGPVVEIGTMCVCVCVCV